MVFVQVLEIVLVWIWAIAWFGLDMSDWVFWVMIIGLVWFWENGLVWFWVICWFGFGLGLGDWFGLGLSDWFEFLVWV